MAKVISALRSLQAFGYLARRLLVGYGLRRQRFVFFLQIGAIALSSGGALLILTLSQSFRSVITERLYAYFGGLWVQYYAAEQEVYSRPIDRHFLGKLPTQVEAAIHLPVLIEGAEQRYEGVQLLAVERSWWERTLWRALTPPPEAWEEESGIILSRRLAQQLGVSIGDRVTVVWLAEPPRLRRLPVLSLYDAQMEEIDRRVAFVPLALGQRLLGWDSTQVQVGHLFFTPNKLQDEIAEKAADVLPTLYEIIPIENIFPDIFGWLGLIEQNVQVILGIVLGLSFFAVTSGFLVLQFSQRLRYEVLWVLGATPRQLWHIALWQALFSIMIGYLLGMLWASLLLWSQAQWGWFRLDPESYLLAAVPVQWDWRPYVYVGGIGTLLAVLLSGLIYSRRRTLRLLAQAE